MLNLGEPHHFGKGIHMKLCIFSDSHGRPEPMVQAVRMENPDMCLFLGDGLRDLTVLQREFPDMPIRCVQGNCDYDRSVPLRQVISVHGCTILLLHGHTCQVKQDPHLYLLRQEARDAGAAVALFGHTHSPYLEEGRILLLNPGSAARGNYGILTVEDGICSAGLRRLTQ